MGRDQPGLRTGIEATAGESRHGYAAGNIAFATKGIGTCIVIPPAPPAVLTRAAGFDRKVRFSPEVKATVEGVAIAAERRPLYSPRCQTRVTCTRKFGTPAGVA